MKQDDATYYRRRCAEELQAVHTTEQGAARIHQAMARRYEILAKTAEARSVSYQCAPKDNQKADLSLAQPSVAQ